MDDSGPGRPVGDQQALTLAARKQNGLGLQTGPVSGPDYLQIERFLNPLYVQTGPLYLQQTCKQPFRPTLVANKKIFLKNLFLYLIEHLSFDLNPNNRAYPFDEKEG